MKTSTKKINSNQKKKVIRILILVATILALVGIIFVVSYVIINSSKVSKYKSYTEKMYKYGLADLYDNKEATITEQVTNDEMLKIVLAAVRGKTELSYMNNFKEQESESKWLNYATDMGFNIDITKENIKEKANILETSLIAIRALEKIQKTNIEQAKLKISKSKLAILNPDEQLLLQKAVNIGIVSNSNETLSDKPMIKGELNKLAVTIIEKFSTLYHGKDEGVNIVTDVNKMPENHDDYPYIIDSIPNEIYEYEFDITTELTAQTPVEAYKYMGNLFAQIDEIMQSHFDVILNVDYETITVEKFINDLQYTLVYGLTENDVKEYVKHVIDNKIKLSGKVEPLLPIIYNNGEQYIVRTKFTFDVLNSNTQYNLLFGDEGKKIRYNGKRIEMYVDVPMGMTLNSFSLRAYITCFANHMINDNPSVIVEK